MAGDMDVRTYRAPTMQQALALVRQELGAGAAVLHTREVRARGLFRLWPGARQIEVTASADAIVPSRLPLREPPAPKEAPAAPPVVQPIQPLDWPGRQRFRDNLEERLDDLHSLVEQLCERSRRPAPREWPDEVFKVFADLVEADVPEEQARELVESIRREPGRAEDLKARLALQIEREIPIAGPIRLTPGAVRVVALVGPTGVGKTTTIAKLAANFRLREKRRVGLITVDTYRIAAVDQLRTYADIIDLPMQVAAAPHEMREAVRSMAGFDVVLIDTAGRSPKDDLKLRELREFLDEAQPHEIHLVQSCVATAGTLSKTLERFSELGATSLVLTKLDEAHGLGNLLPLLRSCPLPLSYLTNGQNVPDDIVAAERRKLAHLALGFGEPNVQPLAAGFYAET